MSRAILASAPEHSAANSAAKAEAPRNNNVDQVLMLLQLLVEWPRPALCHRALNTLLFRQQAVDRLGQLGRQRGRVAYVKLANDPFLIHHNQGREPLHLELFGQTFRLDVRVLE